jgi:PAS domain S-box-containing protein
VRAEPPKEVVVFHPQTQDEQWGRAVERTPILDEPQPTTAPDARTPSQRSGAEGLSETHLVEIPDAPSHDLGVPQGPTAARVEMLEAALREREDHLQFLVDAVTEYAIITLTPEGIIDSWNTGAQRLKGYTAEEALGRHFSLFYPTADRDTGLPQRLLDRARAQRSYEQTGWRVRKDGSQFWADVVISAVHDATGKLTGFVKVVRDLTEQHRLEVAQDSFYNAFEHDFRLPITAIKGFAELIGHADPEDLEHLVERVDANADRLLRMVDELVDYARLRSGLVPISLQTVDMSALARLAVANLASITETSRVRIAASASVKVLADSAALERVIANLVTNALKYSPADRDVDLICELGEDVGELRIIDRGRGIDERDLGSIFLEFERGRLARDDSGTGLGLASVQRLVGLQDGTVTIRSQVDAGTTVTIQLPLAP